MLFAVALAGCAEEAAPAPAETPDVPQGADVETGPDSGAISGVVVDAAILPVEGVRLTIAGTEDATITDALGQFIFEDLEPGTYFLQANATGYFGTQTSVDVVAGEVTKPRIQLLPDFKAVPTHYTLEHHGVVAFNGAVTGALLNIVLEELYGDNPTCSCSMEFSTAGQDTKTLVVEALWEDSIEYPNGPTDLYLEVFPAELDDGTDDIQGGFLTSPLYRHYPIELWGEDETNTEWNVRLSGSGYFVQLEQEYELWVTVFNNAPAPEGWSFVAGDA